PSPPLSPLELEQATLAALVEHSPDAVIGETLEGLITSWNPGAQRLFGYAAPEVIGRHISLLAPPENPVDMLDIIQRVKTGEVVQRVAAERLRKDGQRILVSLAVCPVRAPNGQVIAIIKLAHDITQRHQAQQALQQSEANLRILFNSAQEGVVLHTVEGAILDVNESWCQLHGVSPEQARRLSIADLSSPAMSMDKARQLWAQALRGEPQFFEWDSRRAGDGSPFDAEIFLRRIQMNGQDVVLASVRDITQRKRAAEQERLQSAALQSAANAVAITGRDGIIQSVNPAFTRLTGYPAQEVLGRNARILKSGLQPAAFYTVMWNTILAGQVWRGELINRRKDGSLYSEDMTITPVRDAGGAISHFIAIKQDVTERKQAELALQRQNRQLSILNAAAQALLATREAETALEVIYDRMAQWFQVDSFVEFGLNAAGDTLELVACKVIAGARQPGISRLALGQWIAGKVAQSRTPMVVANAQASLDPDLQFIRALQANAYACEPLVVGERLLGTLSFGSSSRQSFEPEDQAFFQTLANYIALGKERLRLTRELQQHASRLEETVRERTAQLLEANANLQTFADTAAHDLRSPLRSIKVFSSIAADEYGPQLGAE
ncbi:MAG TPA: PAS domain S-box protein, partial [Candidatus Sulfotelmatobacter sp.]|nr:PAS domain S-box protein [Candidatus Sulfotelmatobacter sp.]